MAKAKESTKVRGVVEAVNDKGIKIDGEWYNFSKYNKVETPSEGDEVEIEVREKWIKSLWTLTSAGQQREGKNQSVDNSTRVTRLALLNTATPILSTHGKPVEVESVINTAHVLETYVYEDRHSEDNEDVPFTCGTEKLREVRRFRVVESARGLRETLLIFALPL